MKDNLLLQAKNRGEADRKDLLVYSHRIGQLETEVEHLKQLQAPKQPTLGDNEKSPETNQEDGVDSEVLTMDESNEEEPQPERDETDPMQDDGKRREQHSSEQTKP